MNKKALIGNALTFVVFIEIVIIMLLFISLVAFTATFKKPPAITAAETMSNRELFTETITVQLNDEYQEILVLDAVQLTLDKKIHPETLLEGLKAALDENNNCYILTFDQTRPDGFKLNDGIYEMINAFNLQPLPIQRFIKDDYEIGVSYYYGPC